MLGAADGALAGFVGGGVGTALSSPILAVGNTGYFKDPMMTLPQYALSVAAGGLLGGLTNGITALANGRNFWNGSVKPEALSVPSIVETGTTVKTGSSIENEGIRSFDKYSVELKIHAERKASAYLGRDRVTGEIKYVGITERNPEIRFAEHLNSNTERAVLYYEVETTGLTRQEARILEQQYINTYGLGKNGGQLLNKINSISPKYWDIFEIQVNVRNY